MGSYDGSRFDPPAPLAMVSVMLPGSGNVIQDVPMLIDTGADISLLPQLVFGQLPTANGERYEVEAFDGSKSFAQAVDAEVAFLGKVFRGQFLLVDSWHGILGRNIFEQGFAIV